MKKTGAAALLWAWLPCMALHIYHLPLPHAVNVKDSSWQDSIHPQLQLQIVLLI